VVVCVRRRWRCSNSWVIPRVVFLLPREMAVTFHKLVRPRCVGCGSYRKGLGRLLASKERIAGMAGLRFGVYFWFHASLSSVLQHSSLGRKLYLISTLASRLRLVSLQETLSIRRSRTRSGIVDRPRMTSPAKPSLQIMNSTP
jgi:hypothetical protein